LAYITTQQNGVMHSVSAAPEALTENYKKCKLLLKYLSKILQIKFLVGIGLYVGIFIALTGTLLIAFFILWRRRKEQKRKRAISALARNCLPIFNILNICRINSRF
jgi:hypothetical protein